MKFKFYDILSHLIPGFIIYITYLEFIGETFNKDFVVPSTAIAFVLGYFLNTLSSWLEDFFYWTWGGIPSSRLLDGKDIWKVRFHESERTKKMLQNEASTPITNKKLFSIAKRYTNYEVDLKVGDFNANYAFSRVILTTVLIASGFMIYAYYDSYLVYATTIPLIFVSWLRSKQRGYYYAREVLNTYLMAKQTMI